MGSLGGFIALLGVFSVVVTSAGGDFELVAWIDSWGRSVGWSIRVGLVLVGAMLWLVGARSARPANYGRRRDRSPG